MNAVKFLLCLTAVVTFNAMVAQTTDGLLAHGSSGDVASAGIKTSAKSNELTVHVTMVTAMNGTMKVERINRQVRRALREMIRARRASLGLWAHNSNGNGVIVSTIAKGTSAEAVGLKEGDLISSIDNYPVNSRRSLNYALSNYSAGDVATVYYVRNSARKSAQVKLVSPHKPAKFHRLMWPGDGSAEASATKTEKP